jgi:type II secretory pathway component PulF
MNFSKFIQKIGLILFLIIVPGAIIGFVALQAKKKK